MAKQARPTRDSVLAVEGSRARKGGAATSARALRLRPLGRLDVGTARGEGEVASRGGAREAAGEDTTRGASVGQFPTTAGEENSRNS